MSQKTSLFFIGSPQIKMDALIGYLKKRNYNVYFESDIKAGLLGLLSVQPDFVFLDAQHPNAKISTLPDFIKQCLSSFIVAYVHSNDRRPMHQLDKFDVDNKIYPPLSGPALERQISQLNQQIKKTQGPTESSHEPIIHSAQLISDFLAQEKDDPEDPQKNNPQTTNSSIQPKPSNSVPAPPAKEEVLSLKNKNLALENTQVKLISQTQKDHLQQEFNQKIRAELLDILSTHNLDEAGNVVSLHKKPQKKIYCLLVQSAAWTGHLMAYSDLELDAHLLEPVFKNWISQEFQYFNANEDHLFFEIEIDFDVFNRWVKTKAEYFETLKLNESELIVGFVGIEPKQLLVEFNEQTDLIEVDLDLIPIQTELQLSLFLHLPENKKFLLYTPTYNSMSAEQLQRLKTNKVEKLFTPIQFEPEVTKLKMKKYFGTLFENLKYGTDE